MNEFYISFEKPWYLLLLIFLPFFLIIGRSSLVAWTKWQKFWATFVRLVLALVIIACLAGIQWRESPKDVAVYFVLDQSDSVSQEKRDGFFKTINHLQQNYQNKTRGDTSGTIVFGRHAKIERPLQNDVSVETKSEVQTDHTASNIGEAVALARAAFTNPGGKRVVLMTDGNENLGDVYSELQKLRDDGDGIDIALTPPTSSADVLVQRIEIPQQVRSGTPFDISIWLNYHSQDANDGKASGRLIVTRKVGENQEFVLDKPVTLSPGEQMFQVRQENVDDGFMAYTATFVPDEQFADTFDENNAYTSFTNVNPGGRVLLIVPNERENEYAELVRELTDAKFSVEVRTESGAFSDIADLQSFDSVVMADVSRIDSTHEASINFSDTQIAALASNSHDFGAGLVMIGGPNTFGVGGWHNTALEAAMPVDFQVKNRQVVAVGALAIVMDKSGSMSGEKIALCRAAASNAVSMLGDNDFVGIYAFDAGFDRIVSMQRVGDSKHAMQQQIRTVDASGGTDMGPALAQAYRDLQETSAAVKHLIVLTDGQTMGSGYPELAGQMNAQGITTSSVAVGSDADFAMLESMARRGTGNFYRPTSPQAVPSIFMKETRKVLRPLVYEDASGIALQQTQGHEILQTFDFSPPPITGFVLTTAKDNPLVEILIAADRPEEPNNSVLACWQYGLGRTAAFTTDAGQRWADQWAKAPSFQKLIVQTIRWSMRPMDASRNLNVVTQVEGGNLKVVAHAMDDQGQFKNGVALAGMVKSLSAQDSKNLDFEQTGPGTYQATLPLTEVGDYLVAVSSPDQRAIARTGLSFNNAAEYGIKSSNKGLLQRIANDPTLNNHSNPDHNVGIIDLPEDISQWNDLKWFNIFRPTPSVTAKILDMWPLCVMIASIIFLSDVALRRLDWSLFAFRRKTVAQKVAVQKPVSSVGAQTRYETSMDSTTPGADAEFVQAGGPLPSETAVKPLAGGDQRQLSDSDELSYTERLLRAKRQKDSK
jgi:uncharacterized membrane protein